MSDKYFTDQDTYDMKKETYTALSLFAVIIIIFMVSPILDSGFISDDSWAPIMSAQPKLKMVFIGIYEALKDQFKSSVHFTPVWCIYGPLISYFIMHNLYLYKLYILLMIAGNVILFQYFIFRMFGSRTLSLLSVMFLPLLFQFRNYHDPILGFATQQQLILFTLLCSLAFLISYLEKKKRRWLLLSIFSFLLCTLIYENSSLFFVFPLALVYVRTEKKRWDIVKISLPYIILSILFIFLLACLKYINPANYYTGTTAHFDLSLIIVTYFKQIFAAFPLSYFLFYIKKTIVYDGGYIYRHFLSNVLFLLLICAVFLYYFAKKIDGLVLKPLPRYLPVFGLLFWLVPAVLIALSKKYQEELFWGLGYLPVYLSYYGIAILLASLVFVVFQYINNKTTQLKYYVYAICIVFYCLVVSINYINNRLVVDNLNYTFLYPRQIIEEAAHKGLFQNVEKDALLFIKGDHHWDGVYVQVQRDFYNYIAPGKFNKIEKIKSVENIPPNAEIKAFYYLYYSSLSKDSGYAILGKLEYVPQDEFSAISSKDVYLYVRVPYYKPIVWDWNTFQPKISIEGKQDEKNIGDTGFALFDYHPSMKLISSGIDWRLYHITTDKPIDMADVSIHVDRQYIPMTDMIELNKDIDFRNPTFFSKGWSFPETDLRWTEGNEAVIVFQLKKIPSKSKQTNLVLSAGSNGRQKITISINGHDIGTMDFNGTYETKKIVFNSGLLREKSTNKIAIKIPGAHLPGNGDNRLLGICLSRLLMSEQK